MAGLDSSVVGVLPRETGGVGVRSGCCDGAMVPALRGGYGAIDVGSRGALFSERGSGCDTASRGDGESSVGGCVGAGFGKRDQQFELFCGRRLGVGIGGDSDRSGELGGAGEWVYLRGDVKD